GNDLFNVGLGFNKKQDQHIDQQKFLSLIRTDPVLSPKFKSAELMSEVIGFRLPLGGEEYKISGERFMLAGDAAYLIDPLQGHGIDKAMISGVLAAAQAEKCIKQNNFSAEFMKTYDREVYKKVGKELKRSLKLMKMLHKNPWMLEQLARMTQNERVKEFLYDKIL
ncbi:MAG: geranylgeranyl reductase, partial [Bacteroidetes bacterium]|nr:geranylgeranyl reductase [Bacteroidota bacterium]